MVPRSHIGAQKNDNRPIFDGSRFLSSGSFDLAASIYSQAISMFSVTRRAGWAQNLASQNLPLNPSKPLGASKGFCAGGTAGGGWGPGRKPGPSLTQNPLSTPHP